VLVAIFIYALSVGITMFVMILSETEHPPAAGTALGIAISGFSLYVTIAMVVSVLALSLIHYFFKDHLMDLC
jgi:CBS-domain-containing membrane protein